MCQYLGKISSKCGLKLLLTEVWVNKSVWLINSFDANVVKREQSQPHQGLDWPDLTHRELAAGRSSEMER
jgi:hypothetical protein